MVIPAGFMEPVVLDHQAFRHPTGQGADGGLDLSWDRGKPCGGASSNPSSVSAASRWA